MPEKRNYKYMAKTKKDVNEDEFVEMMVKLDDLVRKGEIGRFRVKIRGGGKTEIEIFAPGEENKEK